MAKGGTSLQVQRSVLCGSPLLAAVMEQVDCSMHGLLTSFVLLFRVAECQCTPERVQVLRQHATSQTVHLATISRLTTQFSQYAKYCSEAKKRCAALKSVLDSACTRTAL